KNNGNRNLRLSPYSATNRKQNNYSFHTKNKITMAALGDIYFKKETLQTIVDVLSKKGENGVSITVSINDESNEYGQNISSFVKQSKEDREAKKKRFYTGN